jgi:maltodextrin utilization protein YvdJ
MKNHRMRGLTAVLLLAAASTLASTASAATLSDIYQVADQLNQQARQSQARIDALTEQTRELLNDYKTVLKEIEGLQVYNRQLERQISSQEREMAQLTRSIDDVTVIERQITPLMMRMIDGLDQFVSLDLPFLIGERDERVERLREMMDRADVTVSEKFSQILQAYQIENEYGRTMEAYDDTVTIAGTPRKVDVLKVGRIALVYQSPDGDETGFFNPNTREWERLGDAYTTPIRNGIRMARQQLSVDMLTLPIMGPEAAE